MHPFLLHCVCTVSGDHFSFYPGTDCKLNLTHLSTLSSANKDCEGSDPCFILCQASVFFLTIPRKLLPCTLLSRVLAVGKNKSNMEEGLKPRKGSTTVTEMQRKLLILTGMSHGHLHRQLEHACSIAGCLCHSPKIELLFLWREAKIWIFSS